MRVSAHLFQNIELRQARAVHHTMPNDSQAFVSEWKGKSLDGNLILPMISNLKDSSTSMLAIVEQVRDGSTLRVRLLMPDGEHQVVNIALAGVRSPRTSSKQGEPSETWGEEVRRVLHILGVVVLMSRPNSSPNLAFSNGLYGSKYCHCPHQLQHHSKTAPMAPRLLRRAFSLELVSFLTFSISDDA